MEHTENGNRMLSDLTILKTKRCLMKLGAAAPIFAKSRRIKLLVSINIYQSYASLDTYLSDPTDDNKHWRTFVHRPTSKHVGCARRPKIEC